MAASIGSGAMQGRARSGWGAQTPILGAKG